MWRMLVALMLVLTVAALGAQPISPKPVFAADANWTADPPKPGSGEYVWCTATASADGDTYTLRNWAPIDTTRPFDTYAYAKRVFTEDVKRAMLFKFATPHTIQDSDVRVTCGR